MPEISPEQWDKVQRHMASADTKLDSIDKRLSTNSIRLDATETFIARWDGGKAVVLGVLVAAGAIGGVVLGVASLLKRSG